MIKVDVIDARNTDRLLGQMPIELREKQLVSAVRKAGNVVKREAAARVPEGEYDALGKPALKDSLSTKIVKYQSSVMAIVGGRWPEGNHAHLVERGHEEVLWGVRSGGRVPPYPFLEPAADSTIQQQRRKVIESLKKAIGKLAK